jgi:hypothetical protein
MYFTLRERKSQWTGEKYIIRNFHLVLVMKEQRLAGHVARS